MQLPLYQLDAFTRQVFSGNPAAVCPLQNWLDEHTMQQIAAENNLSETAFFIHNGEHYEIRWFTPTKEVDLCGHATLAAAYVIFNFIDSGLDEIIFSSKSGRLIVRRSDEGYRMDFPTQQPQPCELPELIQRAFNSQPIECLSHQDYLLVFEHEQQIREATPDLNLLAQIDLRSVCITSAAKDYDFISRVFAPGYGIDEDPVTGSLFTQLTPYWAGQLGKNRLKARQVSQRGGDVICELNNDRVFITGDVCCYMTGQITLN